jgi:hypothetical protein
MGIDAPAAKFLCSEVKRGVHLGRMLTLGHHAVYMGGAEYRSLIESLGVHCQETVFADDLFRGLGAESVDIMDASNYEGANLLHDLNEPISQDLVEKYDCVFDGGTLEHVFNFPIALRNSLDMVKVGGHFITIAPANGFCGHGFYQFSPELFFGALCEKNGFSVERLLLFSRNRWFSVRNPVDIGERVQLCTPGWTMMLVSARRLERKPVFANWPQESLYSRSWAKAIPSAPLPDTTATLKESILRHSPYLSKLQRRWQLYKYIRRFRLSNRRWYTPIRID